MQDYPQTNSDIDPQIAALTPAIAPLVQTRPWVKFMAILGFICCGLMVLIGFFMLAAGLAGGNPIALLGLLYAGFAVLYYFPAKILFDYAAQISAFQHVPSTEALVAALTKQKSFWKFVGVLTAVVLCLYAVILVLMLAAAMIEAMH